MASWNQNPVWTLIDLINDGKQIEPGDGFLASDMVKIVENLQYLYNNRDIVNLENGTGVDSIVQKYSGEVDDTHFANTNSGEGAAVFGEANTNTANRALFTGKMNRANSANSIICGLGNGRGIGATPNINKVVGNNLIIGGTENYNNGKLINGSFYTADNSILAGWLNENYARNSLVIGKGNKNYNYSGFVSGNYNDYKENTLLEIGNGISDTERSNAFEVLKDGRAKVQSAPVDDDDVVRKLELDITQEVFVGGSLPTSDGARIWVDTAVSTSELSKIYGVDKVGQENPTLTRTDNAVGLSYVLGVSEITSDFDNCYPWCNMQEATDSSGNVFIKIPKFYSKVTKNTDGTYKYQISGTKHDGFTTLFVDGKGNELDYVLVGKYEGSGSASRIYSKSGATVFTNITRNTFRTGCKANGKGYQQYDFLIDAIIKELFMIEFATTDSQNIMQGYTYKTNIAAVATGRTDKVKTPSGSEVSNFDGEHACKYRGIENPFGNVWKWCDGINFNREKIYICEDPEYYADDKYIDKYTYVGDRVMTNGYAKTITPFAKNPLLGYTTEIGGGTHVYYSDYYYMAYDGTALLCGGSWYVDEYAGLWYWAGDVSSSYYYGPFGGRLCYKPIRN